jgi:mono/diheme cytochrome c family protein
MLKDNKYEMGPLFTPPVVSKPEGPLGVVISPAGQGGTNWPGGAYDPDTHLLYVFSETTSQVSSLIHPPPEISDMDYVTGRAGQTPFSSRPMGAVAAPRPATAGAPPAGGGGPLTVRGLPLLKPPYGILTAINLDKGDLAWEIAHGETPDNVRGSPALKGLNIPRTGRTGLLGPLVTKTLVIIGEAGFFTAPNGQRGAMLRAYDKATGHEVGAIFMPAPQSGSPMTYLLNGQQYLAIAISGGNYSAELVVYKLPSGNAGSAATQSRPMQPAQPAAAQVAASSAPLYTAAQAGRGHAQYTQQCAVCHGQSLEGIEVSPPLAGSDFIDKWTGQSMGDLFERIRATMPKNKPGSLSREAVADITAYILSVNQYPAGATELPADTQSLKGIRIDAAKPR